MERAVPGGIPRAVSSRTAKPNDFGCTRAVLCVCALTHTYLLFSTFPYAGYFVLYLLDGANSHGHGSRQQRGDRGEGERLSVDNIGIYSGLMGSAFAFGRLFGFFPWRRIRNQYGERTSLVASLLLSATFSMAFGMSKSYSFALFSRFALGMSNGISGSIKRAGINRARSDALNQSKNVDEAVESVMSKILAVMSAGCAFGPAMGGWLTSSDETSKHPYLSPNLFGSALCMLSTVLVLTLVHTDQGSETRKNRTATSSCEESKTLLRRSLEKSSESQAERFAAVWKAKSTRSHLIGHMAFSFCIACIDEALPLFLIARLGGLGLSAPQAGLVLAAAGVITAFILETATPNVITESMGLYPALHLSAALANIPMTLLPISMLLNHGVNTAVRSSGLRAPGMSPASFAFVVLLFGVFRTFGFLYFSLIGMLCQRTVPVSYTDDASRIMTLIGLLARAVAPTVAGGIMTSLSGHPWLVWIVIGLLSTFAAALTYALRDAAAAGLRRYPVKSEVVKRNSSYLLAQRQRALVYAKLWEIHYDKGSDTAGAKWRRLARNAITFNRITSASTSLDRSRENQPDEGKKPRRQVSWSDRQLRPGIDSDNTPFFIIGTHKYDTSCHVMTPPLLDTLYQNLPGVVCGYNYWLKYSLVRDGANLATLEAKAGFSKYNVLAIETLDGDVFGCFMAIPWEMKNKYEACGQSFLWRMNKRRSLTAALLRDDDQPSFDEQVSVEEDIEVYNWTGDNDFCLLFAHDKIAVGGGCADDEGDGFGFVIGDDFDRGSSSPCKTYGNPCLVSGSEGGNFVVANVELWTLTPFLFEADAERSEKSIQFQKQNLLDTPSSESAWSQFM